MNNLNNWITETLICEAGSKGSLEILSGMGPAKNHVGNTFRPQTNTHQALVHSSVVLLVPDLI